MELTVRLDTDVAAGWVAAGWRAVGDVGTSGREGQSGVVAGAGRHDRGFGGRLFVRVRWRVGVRIS